MLEAIDYELVNRWQRDFPLVERPFAAIAAAAGIDEQQVLARYTTLLDAGTLSRIGVVFRPNVVGASTLAALRVPPEALERVAAVVSAQPGVNHNYEREHDWNLWFVVTAADAAARAAILARIAAQTGYPPLDLRLEEEFHIDLGFDLADRAVPRGAAITVSAEARCLSAAERRLVAALEDGLPLVEQPFAALGDAADLAADDVLNTLQRWQASGVVRRIGTVVRHRSLGYTANAMVVWDVADDAIGTHGRALARQPQVTLCYRRTRRLPEWRYNLFCMIHGVARPAVLADIDAAGRAAGLTDCAREVLFSRRCFTQRGARFVAAERVHG